jgi:signal transduction histidine kinase
LDVELVVDNSLFPHFPIEVRLQIIRIIQEALTNVGKHAQARRVELVFRQDGEWLQLSIEDDGCGFDPLRLKQEDRDRFGLAIMHERVASVGGTLVIDSAPGKGTRLQLRVPLQTGE